MTNRTCTKCGPQPLSNFRFKNKAKGWYYSQCLVCQAEYSSQWHQDNKIKHNAQVQINNKRYKTENRTKLLEYLKEHPCIDCGETDPICLDFDHRKPSEKTKAISNMVNSVMSWSTIKKEIAKCDVRCCKCHRRRTAIQFGWIKAA